jgi:hypothetical protein
MTRSTEVQTVLALYQDDGLATHNATIKALAQRVHCIDGWMGFDWGAWSSKPATCRGFFQPSRSCGGRCLLGLNCPGQMQAGPQPSTFSDGLFARGWHESTTFRPCCSHLRCLPIISHLCHTFLATGTSARTSTLRASPKLACATTPWRSRSLAA